MKLATRSFPAGLIQPQKKPCFSHGLSADSFSYPGALIALSRVTRMLSKLKAKARAFREWYQRPTTRELRGQKLLRDWLSLEQLIQFENFKYFDVTGSYTGKRYRIKFGRELNVFELDQTGTATTGWCF